MMDTRICSIFFIGLLISVQYLSADLSQPDIQNIQMTQDVSDQLDGYDQEAMDMLNIDDVLTDLNNNFSSAKIAILDSGIHPLMATYIQQEYDVTIRYFERPAEFEEYEETSNYQDSDINLHGSKMVSLLATMLPSSTFYIYNVHSDNGPSVTNTKVALFELLNGVNRPLAGTTYDPVVNVISLSLSFDVDDDGLERHINNLYASNVAVISGVANKLTTTQIYPESYDNVISVGAIYDDPDGKLTSNEDIPGNLTGQRLTNNYGSVESNKLDNLDYVAPGFDVEVMTVSDGDIIPIVVSGTSVATLFISAIAGMIAHTIQQHNPSVDFKDFDRNIIAHILHHAAEGVNQTDPPVVNGAVANNTNSDPTWTKELGFGIVDAYDAVMLAGSDLSSFISPDNTLLRNGLILLFAITVSVFYYRKTIQRRD